MPRRRPRIRGPLLAAAGLGALYSTVIFAGTAPKPPAAPAPVELPGPPHVERSQLHMGTLLTLRIEADEYDAALDATERVFAAVARAEARLSTWRDDTELARLNAAVNAAAETVGPGFEVSLSPELAADLEVALDCARLTDGAFDPTVGPLTAAWGLRDGGRLPSQSEIDDALDAVGFEGLAELADSLEPTGLQTGLLIDEGGFGKGAALDDAAAELSADPHVRSAMLDFGGQLLVYRRADRQDDRRDDRRDEEARANVSIAHPDDRGRVVAEFTVGGGSVATTGNGERGLVVHGERLGHVLDPRTGLPAEDFGSLTVWIDSSLGDLATEATEATVATRPTGATLADCLSTGLYVLGPDAALRFAARHRGVEVVVAERVPAGRGSRDVRIRASDGLQVHLLHPKSASAFHSAADPQPGTANRTRDDEPHAATHGLSSR